MLSQTSTYSSIYQEVIFEAKDSIIGPELITSYSKEDNHVLLSSYDGHVIFYNLSKKSQEYSSKIELPENNKILIPILSMTYNKQQKAIIYYDAAYYIHYDTLFDTTIHRAIQIKLEDLLGIVHLIDNYYYFITTKNNQYIYEIIPVDNSETHELLINPKLKYYFPTIPTSFYKTDKYFYIACQRAVFRCTINSFQVKTLDIVHKFNILNNNDINDNNEGIITSIFYYNPKDNIYNLNDDNNSENQKNEENSEESSEEEDNSDELLITGNNLGKVDVVPIDNIEKKFTFKCFTNKDYYISVTAIAYDNYRKNIYFGSNDGSIFGLNMNTKKKIFYCKNFGGGIHGIVYIPRGDALVYTVTNYEDKIFCQENYEELMKEQKKSSKDKNEKKENSAYYVTDIEGFIQSLIKK